MLPCPHMAAAGIPGRGWSRCPRSWLAWNVSLELERAQTLRAQAWPDPGRPPVASAACAAPCSPTGWVLLVPKRMKNAPEPKMTSFKQHLKNKTRTLLEGTGVPLPPRHSTLWKFLSE